MKLALVSCSRLLFPSESWTAFPAVCENSQQLSRRQVSHPAFGMRRDFRGISERHKTVLFYCLKRTFFLLLFPQLYLQAHSPTPKIGTHLHYANAGSDIDKKIREDIWICWLENILRFGVPMVHEGFIWNILEQKVATFDQAIYFILLVYSVNTENYL